MKQNKSLFIGLILLCMCVSPLCAQEETKVTKEEQLSYKRVYILDFGLGIGLPELLGSGNSAWHTGKDKDNTLFTSSVQLMTYSPHCDVGYGLFYYGHRSGPKQYNGALQPEINEKTSFYYIAPQASLIKRQLGFPDGIMYVNVGVGYANYRSKGSLLQKEHYKTARSAIGCNMGIAYEYAFDSQWGIRAAVNCVYSRIKGLHKERNTYPGGVSILPRRNSHLFVPSLELGLSYYIVY